MLHLDKRVIPMGLVRRLAERWSMPFAQNDVLNGTELTDEDLADEDKRVSYRQRIQQIDNAQKLVNDPTTGCLAR